MSEPNRSTGARLVRTEKMGLDSPLDARFAAGGTRDPRRATSGAEQSTEAERAPRAPLGERLRAWSARLKRRPVALAPTENGAEWPEPSKLAALLDRARQVGHGRISLPSSGHLLALGILALSVFAWRSLERPLEVRGSDRDLVLTVDDLMGLTGSGTIDPDAESFTKVARLGGAVELDYDYQDGEEGPHLAFVTRFNRSESTAMDDFTLTNVQTMIDWKLAGRGKVGLVPLEGVEDWADQIRAFRVETAGKTIGYSFAARVGDRTLYMALEDVALDDSGAIEHLLGSVLDSVQSSSRPR